MRPIVVRTRRETPIDPAPRSQEPPDPSAPPGLIFAGLYVLLAALALSTAVGAFTPALLVLVAAAAVASWRDPRRGVLIAISVLLLVPQPFSLAVGPLTVSVGRLLLWTTILSSSLHRRGRPTPRTRLDLPMILVLATMAISLVVNLPGLAGFEVGGAVRKLSLFGVDYFAFFWVVVREYRRASSRLQLLQVYTGVSVLVAALAVLEYVTGTNLFLRFASHLPRGLAERTAAAVSSSEETLGRGLIRRVIGTLEQPLALGIVLAMALPLAIALSYAARGRWSRTCWALGAMVIGTAVFFTAARSVYVIVVLTFITILVLTNDRRFRLGIVAGAMLLGAVFLLQQDLRDTMIAFFQPQRGTEVEGSFGNRTADYEPIARRVDDAPLFGYGPRTFARDELVRSGRVPDPRNLVLDNAYLGHLAETGAVGLSALLLLLLTGYAAAWRLIRRTGDPRERMIAIALLCAVQSWVLMGFAADVYVFHAPPRAFFALLAILALQRDDVRR